MLKLRLISLVLVLSISSVAVAASAQEIECRQSDGEAIQNVTIEPRISARGARLHPGVATMASLSLPDAPLPLTNLSPSSLALAGQQQGQPGPSARYPTSNRRKDIVLGVLIVAALVGGIVIATQRD